LKILRGNVSVFWQMSIVFIPDKTMLILVKHWLCKIYFLLSVIANNDFYHSQSETRTRRRRKNFYPHTDRKNIRICTVLSKIKYLIFEFCMKNGKIKYLNIW
jgi:hypothetical protein